MENFLCCKTLSETTKGEEIFEIVDNYLKFANLPWEKCIGVCTDGAPAMTGSVKGFTSFAKKKNENIIFTHCFLHREALMTKTLVGDLREVLDQVVKVINFIKSSSLKSRLFEKICDGMDSDNSKLLFYSAIRWLSRGRVLSRFYDLSEEIIVFLTMEESKYEFLGDDQWWTKVSFLTDIFEHLNKLNSSMQGRNENILTSTDKMMAFNEKLTLWKTQVDQKKLTMFPRTAERNVDASLVSLISESIMLLKDKMIKYFPSINVEDYDWVRNPFSVSVNEVIGLTFVEEDNLISLKNDRTLKLKFKEMTVNKFWIYAQAEFPEISIKAITILLPFSTSYLCEQGFSAVTTIKSKKRERLQSVEEELRVALSTSSSSN